MKRGAIGVTDARMIKHVNFVSLFVRDQDKAVAFYTDKLGFSVHTDQEMGPDARWIEMRIPGAQTKVVLFKDPSHVFGESKYPSIVYACDDVEKTYEELAAKGVEFIEKPAKKPWGWSAMFKDPDGNTCLLGAK